MMYDQTMYLAGVVGYMMDDHTMYLASPITCKPYLYMTLEFWQVHLASENVLSNIGPFFWHYFGQDLL